MTADEDRLVDEAESAAVEDTADQNTSESAEAPPTVELLAEFAVLMWPATRSAQFTKRGRPATPDGADSALREFAFAPSAERPELLVPVSPAPVTAAALRHTRAGAPRGLGRGKKAPTDRLHLLGDPHGEASIEAYLSELLATDVAVSISLDALLTGSQPVLRAYDGSGTLVAVVKIGEGETSTAYLEREARALTSLAEARGARAWQHLRVPRVLFHGDWYELKLLVLSAADADAGTATPPKPTQGPPVDAMAELATTISTGRQTLVDSTFWRRLAATPSQLTTSQPTKPAAARDLNSAMARISEAYGGSSLTLGCWHGNWTPRTTAVDRAGVAHLTGWEWFDEVVPAGFDRLHYLVQAAVDAGGFTAARITETLAKATAGKRAIGEPPGHLLAGLYLVELTCRYQLATTHSDDPVLSERADLLLDLLTAHVNQRRSVGRF